MHIGPFIPGVSAFTEILAMPEIQRMDHYRITSNKGELHFVDMEQYGTNAWGELIPDTLDKDNSPADASFCPGARVLVIAKYRAEGVWLKDIYLKFYNDTLYLVDVRDNLDAVKKLMNKHYGRPASTRRVYDSQCQVVMNGSQSYLPDFDIEKIWRRDSVSACMHKHSGHDENCQKNVEAAFTLCVVNVRNIVNSFDDYIKPRNPKSKPEKRGVAIGTFSHTGGRLSAHPGIIIY